MKPGIAMRTEDLGGCNVIGQSVYGAFLTPENHFGEFMPYRWDRKAEKFYDPSGIEVLPPASFSYHCDRNGDPDQLIHPIELFRMGVSVIRLPKELA